MTRRTLLDFFADVTREDVPFLVYDDGYRTWTWTYRDLHSAAHAFAGQLRASGVAAGSALAIWSENRPEWIAALWGALIEGVVVVPIDYRTSAEFLNAVARIVDAKAILAGETVDVSALGETRPVWKLADVFRLKEEFRLKAEATSPI